MNNKRNLPIIMLIVFILMNFVLSMTASIFNGILDQVAVQLNISIAETGMLNSFYAYGAGIGVPVSLIVFRKFERTAILKAMIVLTIFSCLGTVFAQNFTFLLFSRFMTGIAGNSYGILATATIASLSSKEKIGRSLALLIMGASLALVLGVPLTRLLSEILSWKAIYLILISMMIVSLIYFIIYLPKANHKDTKISFKEELTFFKHKETMVVIFSSLITFLGYGAVYTYITPYLLALFPTLESVISMILIVLGIASFIGNLIGGVVLDKIGYKKALILGTSLQIVLSILIFITQFHKIITVIIIVLWIMNGWFIGLQLNTGVNIATNNKSNFMLSLNGSGIQLGTALGSTLSALIITSFGIQYISLISFTSAIIVLILLLKNKKIVQ